MSSPALRRFLTHDSRTERFATTSCDRLSFPLSPAAAPLPHPACRFFSASLRAPPRPRHVAPFSAGARRPKSDPTSASDLSVVEPLSPATALFPRRFHTTLRLPSPRFSCPSPAGICHHPFFSPAPPLCTIARGGSAAPTLAFPLPTAFNCSFFGPQTLRALLTRPCAPWLSSFRPSSLSAAFRTSRPARFVAIPPGGSSRSV